MIDSLSVNSSFLRIYPESMTRFLLHSFRWTALLRVFVAAQWLVFHHFVF